MAAPLNGEFVGNSREFTANGERFVVWPTVSSRHRLPCLTSQLAYEIRALLYDADAIRRDDWLFRTDLPRDLQTAEGLSDGECLAIHRAWVEAGGRGTRRR
jgi:hypothetical protein